MNKLAPDDLLTLEAYSRERAAFRARVIEHKRARTVHLGAHLTLIFEDRLTIQYQVQEMLRIERIFEVAGIREELDAYNPLIPDGRNLKATLLIEYADPDERARQLAQLNGIEHRIAFRIGDLPPAMAIADEDLDRATSEKTSAVHFLRFEFSDAQVAALRSGAEATIAVNHPAYAGSALLPPLSREALATDFD
jgi:hypothetical protein